MKFKHLAVWAFGALLFVGCTDNDDSENVNTSIVGTWDLISLLGNEASDLNGDGASSNDFIEELPCFDIVQTFNADGSFTAVADDVLVTLGDPMDPAPTFDCSPTTETTMGTWTLSGNQLTITADTDTMGETVSITLVGNRLSFSGEVSDGLGMVTFIFERRQ